VHFSFVGGDDSHTVVATDRTHKNGRMKRTKYEEAQREHPGPHWGLCVSETS